MRRRYPRVLDLVDGAVRVEHECGDPSVSGRVAVVAHHSDGAELSPSVHELVRQFAAAGYRIVLVSTAPDGGTLDWDELTDGDGITVLRKPNVGYDFGSWAVALATYPQIREVDRLLLVNDSLLGPFASLDPLLEQFERTPADVWGLTETLQFTRHVQSYFVGYRRGVLAERPLARFWRDVRHYGDKQLVIHRGELGLARLLRREGFAVDAAYPAGSVVGPGDNPTIAGWRRLLEAGFPFVKRELVRRPELVPDGSAIAEAVERNYATRLSAWGSP